MNVLEPESFLLESQTSPVVDVRSPGEFGKGHIPGAINIPLFNDAERAEIGTIYVQTGRQEAIERGLEVVGPKMSEFAKLVKDISPSGRLLVYCWRGGMRSESMAWLFERTGIITSTLKGGYKAYRNYLLDRIGTVPGLIVLEGHTGSGKTEILRLLHKNGEQVVDLEKIAGHRGSVFGGIGLPGQPSSQQFENNLFHEILKLDPARRTWIEGESKSIGKVFLPAPLWDAMTEAVTFQLNVPLEARIDRLAKEYSGFPEEEMENAIHKLSRRLGEVTKNQILGTYREKHYKETARLLLLYYDKLYHSGLGKNRKNIMPVDLPDGNAEDNYKILIQKADRTGIDKLWMTKLK